MVPAMSHALLIAALLLAQSGQTPAPLAPRAGSDLTRSLNSAPPAAVATPPGAPPAAVPSPSAGPSTVVPTGVSARPEAAPVRPGPSPTPPPMSAPAVAPTVAPRPTTAAPAPAPQPRPTAPVTTPAPRVVAPVTAPPVATRPPVSAPVTAPTTVQPRPAPAPATAAPAPAPTTPATAPAAPPPPAPTVLDAPAIAALPFTVELPSGLTVTTGRPGPNFNIWTIRRGQQPLVMIYAGPASQFPIYSGEMVEAGGRATVVATEDGRRVALEHLFTRTTAPQEIHVWITSVDGADRALAEQIGQSIDAR